MAYYEFGGITFYPEAGEHQPLVSPSEFYSSIRHIPYSDYNVVDLGGMGAHKYTRLIRVAPEDSNALYALRQATDTLIIAGLTYTGTLLSLTNKSTTPRGEWVFWDADWVVGESILV